MRKVLLTLAAVGLLAGPVPALAKGPCKDAKGRFVKCPKQCRDKKGHFIKCK